MKLFSRLTKKSEKGQVLVIVALTMVGLVAVIGLAIDTGYMYVSYSRLRRAVDAAGLAATGEFKRPPDGLTHQQEIEALLRNVTGASLQMLSLNGVVPDSTASFSDPTTGTPGVSIETCDTTPLDPDLCKDPPQKLVRIKVQERVPVFFLAVLPGFPRTFPITVQSISQAASLDVILLIDNSESMAWYDENDVKYTGNLTYKTDPKACNDDDPGGADGYEGSCFPFQKVKAASLAFIDQLYFPYDRVGVVTFNQRSTVDLALSPDPVEIEDAIQDLKVYQGSGPCAYTTDDPPPNKVNLTDRDLQSPVPPYPYTDPAQITKSCRLYNLDGSFYAFDCPLFYGPDPSTSLCGNTNPGAGFTAAGNSLAGSYPATPPVGTPGTRCVANANCPPVRDDAVWVVIYLSDGPANSAFATNNVDPICPAYTQLWDWFDAPTFGVGCRDNDSNKVTGYHNSNSNLYDPDDYARDRINFVVKNNAFIFSIAMPGSASKNAAWSGDPPAQALLKYAAEQGGGDYYDAANASQLNKIFLAIANKIATRITH